MSIECQGKGYWPELLGVKGATAVATIEQENPLVTAVIVLEGTIVEINIVPVCTRVRVWVDENGIVTREPVIG